MLPALMHEIACSVLRPPNTTATRVFGGVVTFEPFLHEVLLTLLCVSHATGPCLEVHVEASRGPGGDPARRGFARIPVLYPGGAATPPGVVWTSARLDQDFETRPRRLTGAPDN